MLDLNSWYVVLLLLLFLDSAGGGGGDTPDPPPTLSFKAMISAMAGKIAVTTKTLVTRRSPSALSASSDQSCVYNIERKALKCDPKLPRLRDVAA